MAMINRANQQLILQAMVSMASADGETDTAEIAVIRSVYANETGEDISTRDVTHAAAMLRASSENLSSVLSIANATMDKPVKEVLLKASYLVLLADGRVAARERKRLQDFANALKISEIHLSVILEDVSS
jgi:tellurite resistance protein